MHHKPQSSYFSTAFLDKKVHRNPKYKDVKPVVDTGNTIKKYIDTLKESHKNNQFKADEVFKRIKLSAFVRLVIELAKNEIVDDPLSDCGNVPAEKEGETEDTSSKGQLSPYQSVLVGIGEWDRKNNQLGDPKRSTSKESPITLPYLLLDVRTQDEYLQCNIITAKNYPSAMLSRSPGYETKDLLQYLRRHADNAYMPNILMQDNQKDFNNHIDFNKNVPKAMIILYDEEESVASRVATTLVQRGYDNIFVLCGGLKMAQEKFPRGLLNGIFSPIQQTPNSSTVMTSTSELGNFVFKNDFTEEDILELTLDMYFTSMGGSSKAPTSYAASCKSSQSSCKSSQRTSTEFGQYSGLRKVCAAKPTMLKPKPWK